MDALMQERLGQSLCVRPVCAVSWGGKTPFSSMLLQLSC